MKYKLVKETKPTLTTFGKYKAVAVHDGEVGNDQLLREVCENGPLSKGTVMACMTKLSEVINRHLRRGDKVRLDGLGMMKLEIESEKVDILGQFRARKHIRGVRLHFLPESSKGKPELYQDIRYERDKRQ